MIFGEKIISVIPHSYSVAVSASALTTVAERIMPHSR